LTTTDARGPNHRHQTDGKEEGKAEEKERRGNKREAKDVDKENTNSTTRLGRREQRPENTVERQDLPRKKASSH
jgi:hypothetical protein